jgi:hypothetical protein
MTDDTDEVAKALKTWAEGQDEATRNMVAIICNNLRRIRREPQSEALRDLTKNLIADVMKRRTD